ncbi:hypothetical protein Plim_3514 [Planctopirus limnophila DSM 3776]|uniref:Uncharacterized protein n=1 Tax=Planctopirus limnophila (strain ATCC 43296 / DSM 3776 / IFAM 1008 / Mu 290) TaxID=521674 RepID=D5SV41_PLAL2|nr:hypothetical protein Plim_3514 [Planctopirus limnophila DSM 3776]
MKTVRKGVFPSKTLARVCVGEGGTKCRVRVLPLGMD